MEIKEIVSKFERVPTDSSLYLISALSDCAGLFADGGQIAYLVQNKERLSFECIETEYLSLKTNVHVHAVENAKTFKDDYYNVIVFKGNLDDTNLEVFLKLCIIHSGNLHELNFKDFFYSLISLFQLPVEQLFKNALGLYGELKFMQFTWNSYDTDISMAWHKSGSQSRFDFTLGKTNFEIKSTISNELIVSIKHTQIFGDHICYLVVVRCEKCDDGETIVELIDELGEIPQAFKNLNYSMNLQKELKRISPVDATTIRFKVISIDVFDTVELNPFQELPCTISNLSYQYDLSDAKVLETESVRCILEGGA